MAEETEIAEIDRGLAPGNYFDYKDHEVALQAELDLLDPSGAPFVDETFPADARSLYFDPLHPPKGALPGISIKWRRICTGEVFECDEPKYFMNKPSSALINQGALGDGYVVNTMRIMATHPNYMNRLLVSDKMSHRGIYTFKFYKAGRWRYVHIDDQIACRQSGKVNFARNEDPNETFAMLVEKAYAKLHGCYEALIHGLIERSVLDFTPAGDTKVLRNEFMDLDDVCDNTWSALEQAVKDKQLIGAGKFVPDPYSERLESRQGITCGIIYEVIDVQVVTADPTEDLDRLTVGMVCIRNLQKNEGFFNGPWSMGHQNWTMYRQIGTTLRHRTRELMFERGLGLDPNQEDEDGNKVNFVTEDEFFDTRDRTGIDQFLALEQPDEPDALQAAFIGRAALLSPQPYERDIHWVQIEDYVDVFNRSYIITDVSFSTSGVLDDVDTKVFFSKWVPGEYLFGSGGPPLELPPMEIPRTEEKREKEDLDATLSIMDASLASVDGGESMADMNKRMDSIEAQQEAAELEEIARKKAEEEAAKKGTEEGGDDATEKENKEGAAESKTPEDAAKAPGVDEDGVAESEAVSEGAGLVIYDPLDSDSDEEGKGRKGGGGAESKTGGGTNPSSNTNIGFGPYYSLAINENFTDNPMYPFSMSEPGYICVALYQEDRRWSVGRLGEEPRDITSSAFASRGERLAACMEYQSMNAIGFVIVKLFGLKKRCTEFKLRKVVACSHSLCYSNAATCSTHLLPGRYAVIPYTDEILEKTKNYMLHFHFKKGALETEVEDVIEEKLVDADLSDDESSDEEEEEEDSDEDISEDEMDRRFAQRELQKNRRKFDKLKCKPPLPWTPQPWEYLEHTEVSTIWPSIPQIYLALSNSQLTLVFLLHLISLFPFL